MAEGLTGEWGEFGAATLLIYSMKKSMIRVTTRGIKMMSTTDMICLLVCMDVIKQRRDIDHKCITLTTSLVKLLEVNYMLFRERKSMYGS